MVSSLNQHFDNHMCLFELFSLVNDVAHGPLGVFFFEGGGGRNIGLLCT